MAPRTTAKPRTNGRAPVRKIPTKAIAPVELTDEPTDEFDEREPLFSLAGKVYDIPVRVPVADTLAYADIWMERGITWALIWAMKRTIGEDGYRLLTQHRSLTSDQIAEITAIVRSKFDGSDPKGRPRTG
jgi:hypothetical protein